MAKGMGKVTVVSPTGSQNVHQGKTGPGRGTIKTVTPAPSTKQNSTSQPNTKSGKIVTPTRSK